jgi:uncharacterized protein YjbI with pentapeptide repeats
MAEEAHVEALLAGPKEWRELRDTLGGRRPDLSTADLRSRDLRRADLGGVDLRHADLSHANLRRAFLRGARLSGAKLVRAKLEDSNLAYTDLTEADLTAANLRAASIKGAEAVRANLSGTKLRSADLARANLTQSNLGEANLTEAILSQANLTEVNLTKANLTLANLTKANLTQANLTHANLTQANLVQTTVAETRFSGSRVYGVSSWDLNGLPADEQDLIITPPNDSEVTVDRLKVAQFIYLLLSNEEIRDVIDTITSKTVLILGRFTPGRKAVLDLVRTELRDRYNYSPIVFDFEKPISKSLTDTVRLLASMARFVVVDLSDARSANYELGVLSQLGLTRTPFVIMAEAKTPTMTMVDDVLALQQVLDDLCVYRDLAHLSATLAESVIEPAEEMWRQLNRQR